MSRTSSSVSFVHLEQAEERTLAQSGDDPALHHLHRAFHFGFVARLSRAGRQDGDAVMRGHIVVGGVQIGFVAAGFAHSRLGVVGNHQHRQTAEIFESPDMRADPAGQLLAPGGFGKGVTAESHDGHEDRRLVDRAGVAVVNRNRGAGIIDKQLFAGVVLLP